MTTVFGLLAVAALILANGFFVAAEFSYVAARRNRLEARAEAGEKRARRAIAVLRRLSFMLSGAQLGITVTSLLAGYIAEPTLGRALLPLVIMVGLPEQAAPGIAFGTAFVVVTALQMVFGELAPKNLSIAKPEPVALALATPTWLYTRGAGPVIAFFDASANRLLRAIGIEPVEELSGGASPEELERIVAESSREGALDPGKAAMLARALEFPKLRAMDAMVARPHVVAIPADATCWELQRLAADTGHSRFPAIGEHLDDVQGVVAAKDVFRIPVEDRARTPVRALLSPPLAVPETVSLRSLLADLRASHSPLAVLVDEHGGTAGIVTLEDVVEELVGEIEDEYDPRDRPLRPLRGGGWLVPGEWRIDEASRELGLDLPEGDYETLGGLVMSALGRVPQTGDEITVESALLRVASMDGLAVGRLRVTPLPDERGPA